VLWIIQWAKSATWRNEFNIPIRNFAKVSDGVYRGALPGADAYLPLANKLGEHGKTLKKGMIVSTGSMVACQFVPPGSTAVGKIDGLGEVSLKYELPR
jgi:2-keto-4-pentenoate hydratase